MTWLVRLLRAFVLGLLGFLAGLAMLIGLLVALILVLLAWLWELIQAALRGKNLFPEEIEDPCGRLPEAVMRRPDPAIYSQRLLMSQGLPVTWNNPDIWIAPASNPAAIEPDSYHLDDDADYIVTVRVHNASTDAAIGVRVRLRYRPWSFNSPTEIPVEVDGAGNEIVRFVNVTPMGSALATFRWHTPPVPAESDSTHYCLQASLFHPLDTNTANNIGQENTSIWRTPNPGLPAPGETLDIAVPLHNFSKRSRRFVFTADTYAIEDADSVTLRLKTTHGYARRSLPAKAANLVPSVHVGRRVARPWRPAAGDAEPTTGRQTESDMVSRPVTLTSRSGLVAAKNRYEGFEDLRQVITDRDYSLPPGMVVAAEGADLREGLQVQPGTDRIVRFSVTVPNDAAPGDRLPLNLLATTDDGVLAGGVTIYLHVRED